MTLLNSPEFITVVIGFVAALTLLVKNYADTMQLKQTATDTKHAAQDTKDHVTNGNLADQIAAGIEQHQRNLVMSQTIPQDLLDMHKRLHEQ